MLQLKEKYDIIIAGAGVAGLNAALFLPRDKDILLISKESPKHSDSYLAQGGICVLKWDGDHDIFFEDTLRAGHYENNRDTVECMLRSSRETISDLLCAGCVFRRIKKAISSIPARAATARNASCTTRTDGREITSRLYAQAKKLKNVHIRPYTALIDLLCDERENVCAGAVLRDEETGEIKAVSADYVILATGGVGGLFRFSTNYRNLTGDGVAVCLKHGIEVENVDYIQIHPTTLYTKKRGRRFLISESVRGEGAVLLGADGQRFTDELQPRDVVAAAIYAQMEKDGADHVLLDLRTISPDIVRAHFPAIVRRCAEEGYDVFNAPIPVVPGQHYFMGGVKSDLEGKTSMSRLFAVGETCCNGVHGKNRLASNSLLESLVFAKRAALRIANTYEPLSDDVKKRTVQGFDEREYQDKKGLAERYKKSVLSEIEKEKEQRKQ